MRTVTFGFVVSTGYGDQPTIKISDNCDEDAAAAIAADEIDLLIEKLRAAKDEILANAESTMSNRS